MGIILTVHRRHKMSTASTSVCARDRYGKLTHKQTQHMRQRSKLAEAQSALTSGRTWRDWEIPELPELPTSLGPFETSSSSGVCRRRHQ